MELIRINLHIRIWSVWMTLKCNKMLKMFYALNTLWSEGPVDRIRYTSAMFYVSFILGNISTEQNWTYLITKLE